MALKFFQSLLQHSDASGSKSTVLKSLTWYLAILFVILLSTIYFKAPSFVTIFIMVIIGLISGLFIFSFLFCLFKDRDALRSESYSITKMQIEKGVYGDNSVGLLPEKDTLDIKDSNESIEDLTA